MSSIAYLDYNYTKTDLRLKLQTHFAIPAELQHELEEYKLIYWSARELYKRLILSLDGQHNYDYYINRQDTLYAVTMINCSIDQIYDFAMNGPDYQIRISFRRARKHWDLPAVAIIKLPAERKALIDLKDSKGNYNHA